MEKFDVKVNQIWEYSTCEYDIQFFKIIEITNTETIYGQSRNSDKTQLTLNNFTWPTQHYWRLKFTLCDYMEITISKLLNITPSSLRYVNKKLIVNLQHKQFSEKRLSETKEFVSVIFNYDVKNIKYINLTNCETCNKL